MYQYISAIVSNYKINSEIEFQIKKKSIQRSIPLLLFVVLVFKKCFDSFKMGKFLPCE